MIHTNLRRYCLGKRGRKVGLYCIFKVFSFKQNNEQDLFPVIGTPTHHVMGRYMRVLLFVVLWTVSLLKRELS